MTLLTISNDNSTVSIDLDKYSHEEYGWDYNDLIHRAKKQVCMKALDHILDVDK